VCQAIWEIAGLVTNSSGYPMMLCSL
jgi:hypothetical protein